MSPNLSVAIPRQVRIAELGGLPVYGRPRN